MPIGGQQALGSVGYVNSLVENVKESFARTMLALIAQNRPFTDAFTTNQYMMTPPLMEFYGYLDAAQPTDTDVTQGSTDGFLAQNPGVPIVVEDTTALGIAPVTLAETLDATSANYMQWSFPNMAALAKTAVDSGSDTSLQPLCDVSSRSYRITQSGTPQPGVTYTTVNESHVLHDLIYGTLDTYIVRLLNQLNCVAVGIKSAALFQAADFQNWKMVTIHQPNDGSGAKPVRFYDVPTLQNPATTDLVLSTPRIGFYTTPAFQANWQTNMSNQMRVTMNQTFIVALGAQVDGTDQTTPMNPPGIDTSHSAPGTQCFGCHQILDPSRSIFQATYSYGYGQQTQASLTSVPGWFVFQGVINQNMKSIMDLGTTLTTHPLVPIAWTQKLCYYATSQACDTSDPVFMAIAADFANGFSWPTLVRELFSSPLVTNASETATYDQNLAAQQQAGVADPLGAIVSISRNDHLCATLSNRLNIVDVCALEAPVPPTTGVPLISPGLPSDGYGRGAPVPVLPTQPNLFYRAGTENICEDIANSIIDSSTAPAGATTYSSASQADVDSAIADFVGNLMALESSDPRTSQVTALLQAHYAEALAPPSGSNITPASPSDALKSTFIVACSSPSVTGIGM